MTTSHPPHAHQPHPMPNQTAEYGVYTQQQQYTASQHHLQQQQQYNQYSNVQYSSGGQQYSGPSQQYSGPSQQYSGPSQQHGGPEHHSIPNKGVVMVEQPAINPIEGGRQPSVGRF